MLTLVLIDDCRQFIKESVTHVRRLSSLTLSSKIINLGGDFVSALRDACETDDLHTKSKLVSGSLKTLKSFLFHIELCGDSEMIEKHECGSLLKRGGKLIERLESALADIKKHISVSETKLQTTKKVFSTSRLVLRTISEPDLYATFDMIKDLYSGNNRSFNVYDFDSLRKIINGKSIGDIYLISRHMEDPALGLVIISKDKDSIGRVCVEIFVSCEQRGRGYFSETLDGIVKYAFQDTDIEVLSVLLPMACNYLEKSCSRCGFESEGIKRVSCGDRFIVMSMMKNEIRSLKNRKV